jgi:hypothetical protein
VVQLCNTQSGMIEIMRRLEGGEATDGDAFQGAGSCDVML